jgi:two-component system response regulator AtoC
MLDPAPQKPASILIVEDDSLQAEVLTKVLVDAGHTPHATASESAMRAYLDRHEPELVLLDLQLPDASGLDLIPGLTADQMLAVVVITATSDIDTVVEAMQRGADHFLTKPIDPTGFITTVNRVLERHRQRRRVLVYHDRVRSDQGGADSILPEIVGSSEAMETVRHLAQQVAATDSAVVLLGESGTGKGVIAQGIHRLSQRASEPFVDLNCASLQPHLLESELFGHEKGAFTSADSRKPGLMEIANNGSLFLDEIIEMDLQAQSKLLKAIEQGTFRRVGGVKEVAVDVRFITATQRDLASAAEEGVFRDDLYYRLNVFEIRLPPLRERPGDAVELASHFVRSLNPIIGRRVERISPPALERLQSYHWPGNVRELRNVIERAMILVTDAELDIEHLPANLLRRSAPTPDKPTGLRTLEAVEAEHLLEVLKTVDFNIQGAARILGISRSALYAKMRRHGIDRTSSAKGSNAIAIGAGS